VLPEIRMYIDAILGALLIIGSIVLLLRRA
jgi:nitrate reductase gamma subunit